MLLGAEDTTENKTVKTSCLHGMCTPVKDPGNELDELVELIKVEVLVTQSCPMTLCDPHGL